MLSPSLGQTAYHHRQMIGSFESVTARRAFDLLITPEIPPWSNHYHRDIQFLPVRTSKIRLRVGNDFAADVQIAEIRVFSGDAEWPRAADWRLTSSRNPWEVPLAFDSDPWSWWTSGDFADKSTWIEIDFPAAVALNRLTVDQIEDQRWIRLVPEAFVEGEWKELSFHESAITVPPPDDLRMCIRDELKSLGVRWILLRDGTPEGEDLRKMSPQWGVAQIASTGAYRLWKLL